jgi:hypothetical protein
VEISWQNTQRFLNQKELIKLVLTRKERIAINEFTHDASSSPHINLLAVVSSN